MDQNSLNQVKAEPAQYLEFVFVDDIRKEHVFLESYLKAVHKSAFTQADAKRYQLYRLYLAVIMAAETFRYGWFYSRLQGMWAKAQIKNA